jgi:acyl-homoserine lactone acylase PvdQ
MISMLRLFRKLQFNSFSNYFGIILPAMKYLFLCLLFPLRLFAQPFSKEEVTRWEKEAQSVTIIRDNYGVPHIYGKTDADAVFGLMYAQCEDDFKRVEMNYLEKLGRIAEVKGESEIYEDLLNRIIIDQDDTKNDYLHSPPWLKKLCNAFADGVNYYLYKHPAAKTLLNRFEPWFPLMWTDGSIGAISTAGISMAEFGSFFSGETATAAQAKQEEEKVTGSNGFAFSPRITASGHAILYINPHVTFYFRPEVHMTSEEGLNVYGAVTWGQFFVYQGFNEHCGWMHTSSAVDAADSYIEDMTLKNGRWYYKYNKKEIPAKEKKITVVYKAGHTPAGSKTFTVHYTGHGPVIAKPNGNWVSLKADNRMMNGLIQCWQRTKAKSFADFKKTLELRGNISNNTVYADAEGNIAYWHGNRIPVRDPKYDWSKPVDGTTPATEWKGYHPISQIVQSVNPVNGWLQNCNSTPYTVAGKNSPKKNDYPSYMAPDEENFRGVNAVRVLGEGNAYTLDKVISAGYDTRLTAFEVLVPALVRLFEKNIHPGDSLYATLLEPIKVLKNWDYRCGENSVATTLAVEWGQRVFPLIQQAALPGNENTGLVFKTRVFASTGSADQLLLPLAAVIKDLETRFGRWQTAWGEINSFQRIAGDIDSKFDDSQPSIPVGFVSSTWGMLPSYSSRRFPGTQKRYGVNGNSFICAVEFGKKISAKSLLAGGESGDPGSSHFFDQALMYSKGQFKEVLFYKEDVLKHVEKSYHPGESK